MVIRPLEGAAGRAVALRRDTIVAAIRWAKKVHHAALRRAVDVGGGARVVAF